MDGGLAARTTYLYFSPRFNCLALTSWLSSGYGKPDPRSHPTVRMRVVPLPPKLSHEHLTAGVRPCCAPHASWPRDAVEGWPFLCCNCLPG